MNLRKTVGLYFGGSLIAATLLWSLLELTGVTRFININALEFISAKQNDAIADFTLVELPDDPILLPDAFEQVVINKPKRIFWILPDRALTAMETALIERHKPYSIKLPSFSFDKQGNLTQGEQSDWFPTAGYLIEPSKRAGISRQLPTLEQSKHKTLLSPIVTLYPEAIENNTGDVFIDFSITQINSVVVPKALLENQQILSNLLQNKDIYILPKFDLLHALVSVPYSDNQPGWHPVQYHAAALHAFENDKLLTELLAGYRLALIGMVTLFLLMLFVVNPPSLKRISVIFAGGLLIILSVPVADVFDIYPPLIELFIAVGFGILGMELVVARFRHLSIDHLDGLLDVEEAMRGTEPDGNNQVWNNIANMVAQSLQLERCIFLELEHGENHLNEISAVNCSVHDINEMRRDIRREPYVQAVQAKQAVESSRSYFKNKQDDELEILVPFFKGTKVLGFWALTTLEQEPEKIRQIKEQANLFALHISTLLGVREQAHQGEQTRNQLSARFGSRENQKVHQLGTRLHRVIAHSQLHKSLFSSMNTPVVIFDVFGQVANVNTAMRLMGNKSQIQVEHVTAFEFLSQILPVAPDSLRNLIRQLTLEQSQQASRFFITINNSKYVAVLSSIRHESNVFSEQEVHLKINGLMVELHSLKDVQAYLEIERSLYDNFLIRVKDYLTTLQMGLMQVERRASNKAVSQLSLLLNIELKKAADLTRRTHYFMNKASGLEDFNAIPFNPLDILKAQLDKVKRVNKEDGISQDIEFETKIPGYPTMGLGSPDAFRQLLHSSLLLLIDDAITPKKVKVLVKQQHLNDTDVLYIKLESEGYGLPNEQLQKLYEQNAVLGERTVLSDLLMALKVAKDANMDCRLKSKVGKGYRLSILVEGINLDD
ncbi:MAG: hypothetical protein GJ680_08370 [Alteromonadaceae bacterium]|nr:hypothetical protein [Alteromonadaceae bacterium]